MGLLYTRMKVFHFPEKLDSLPRSVPEARAPLQVRIKPTNLCNHNCSYCAYRTSNLQLGKDMRLADSIPREKMLEIVDDLAATGVRSVTFSGGGDPLCYQHLAETLERLGKTHLRFAALTNGSRLEGDVADIFAARGSWLRVSIDGWDGESYARYRRVSTGEFDRVVHNMEAFAKRPGRRCLLGVCIVVDATNHAHVGEMIARMRDAGASSVKVAPCIVDNDGARNDAYHAPFFESVKRQVAEASERLSSPGFEVFDSYHSQLRSFAKDYDWCPYLQICPVIGADMNIYSCHDKAYNLETGLLGSLRDERFRDLWFSEKGRFFGIVPSKVCNHHCVADASNRMILEYLDADPEHLDFV